LKDRDTFSADCITDLEAIATQRDPAQRQPLDINSLIDAISGAQFQDGIGSSAPVSSLYLNPATAAAAAGNGTVNGLFSADPGTVGKAQLGTGTAVGTNIYFNPGLVSDNLADNEGLLLHEGLHLLGFDDDDVQRALFGQVTPGLTDDISTRLEKDCVKGPGNQ
jgi:hypothetical protein